MTLAQFVVVLIAAGVIVGSLFGMLYVSGFGAARINAPRSQPAAPNFLIEDSVIRSPDRQALPPESTLLPGTAREEEEEVVID
jgi:hypothetical protein